MNKIRKVFLLFLFSAPFFIGGQSYAISTPVTNAPECYLAGVNRIIISAYSVLDDEGIALINLRSMKRIPEGYFDGHDLSVEKYLRTSLNEDVTSKVVIETVRSAGINPYKIEEENVLLLEFSFGHKQIKFGESYTLLGAVYPIMKRLPPKQLRDDRTSGYIQETGRNVPAPFILTENEKESAESLDSAIQRSVSDVATRLNYLFPVAETEGKCPLEAEAEQDTEKNNTLNFEEN